MNHAKWNPKACWKKQRFHSCHWLVAVSSCVYYVLGFASQNTWEHCIAASQESHTVLLHIKVNKNQLVLKQKKGCLCCLRPTQRILPTMDHVPLQIPVTPLDSPAMWNKSKNPQRLPKQVSAKSVVKVFKQKTGVIACFACIMTVTWWKQREESLVSS